MTTTQTVAHALSSWEEYSWTNAFVHVDPDAVRHEATTADGGALHGDLFSVKDLFAVAGVPSRAGSLVLDDFRPDVDAIAVSRVRRAGAVFFGKTNCAEFGFGIDTDTHLGGRVLHPDNPDLSPGGSSGGDAVAVATGIVDFAIAGDYGGSIRWPAQSVGIYGLRPGPDVLPRDGRIGGLGATRDNPVGFGRAPWQLAGHLEVPGVMARTPGKIADVLRAASDLTTTTGAVRGRVLITAATEIAPVGDDVRATLDAVADQARARGFQVDEVDGLFRDAWQTYALLRQRLDDHAAVRALAGGREDLLCSDTRAVLDGAPRDIVVDSTVRDAWATAAQIGRRLRQRLAGYDAVILPCAPTGAVGFAEHIRVDGTEMTGHQLMAHLRAVSLTALPALSMPAGRGADGRPISVQLVGGVGTELTLCTLAERLAPETSGTAVLGGRTRKGASRVTTPRIGFVVPSSNPTMERLLNSTGLLSALGISAVCTRVRVRSVGDGAAQQFDPNTMADAADLLADCECDAIMWAGTTGFWLSEQADDDIAAAMAARTGVTTSTTHRAQLAALADVGAQRIGLYTPNADAVHRRVVDQLTAKGYVVEVDKAGGITRNIEYAKIPQADLDATVSALAGPEGRPVAVISTNVSTTVDHAVDSAIASVWWAARLTGATDRTYRQAHEAARHG